MATSYSIHGKSKTPVPDELQVHSFPYDKLMEKQTEMKQANSTDAVVGFSDEIWWEQLDKKGVHQKGKGAPRDKQSIVRGRNRIDPKGVNGASYLWRGYKWLKPFTSNWQVVAYSHNFISKGTEGEASQDPVWIVTYFTATIFTDAGIDLYVKGTLSDEQYDEIVKALQAHEGETEADKELQSLAKQMFRIPVGNV